MTKRQVNRLPVAAALLLFLITFAVLTAAPAYARYLTRSDNAVVIQTGEKKTLSSQIEGEWGKGENADTYTATYTLTGETAGRVRLFLPTAAVESGTQTDTLPTVTMTVAGEIYTAQAVPLAKGTPLYAQQGEGWLYTFYHASGKEWRYTPSEDITITFSTTDTNQILIGMSQVVLCLDEVCE